MSFDPSPNIDPVDNLPPEIKVNTLGKLGVIVFVKSLVELFQTRKDRVWNSFYPTQAQRLPAADNPEKKGAPDQAPGPNW